MSNILFHNKFHRTTHHTVSSPFYPDSFLDPIASSDKPFLGIFYNRITTNERYTNADYITFGNENMVSLDLLSLLGGASYYLTLSEPISTNSFEWGAVYASVATLSAGWQEYLTARNTVTALSSNWQSAYNFYINFNYPGFASAYTSVNTLSNIWQQYPNKHLTNLAQEDTRAKNFAATTLVPTSALIWNLSANQVTSITLTTSATFVNTVSANKKKGGKYILMARQDKDGGEALAFSTDYVFGVAVSAATINDYVLYGTGVNSVGQLGLQGSASRNTLVALTGRWSQVTCGGSHTMAVSAGTTRLFGTGNNFYGQLGVGDLIDKSSFTPLTGNWSQVACGENHTMAISAGTGKLFAAGFSFYGQLGLGTTNNRRLLTGPLSGDWSKVICGYNHTMILSGTKLYAAGWNNFGQLGLGNTANRTLFTPLTGDWSQVACGNNHTMAQSAGTTIWFGTGVNTNGQLGLDDTSNRTSFTMLTGNWSQMVCGNSTTFALSTGTSKWFAAGDNTLGQLGAGGVTITSTFIALTGDWSALVCKSSHTMVLSGTKWYGTGLNTNGQLGLGDNTSKNTFTPLTGNWSQMVCGGSYTMAFDTNTSTKYSGVSGSAISTEPLSITVVKFTSDGSKLYGRSEFYTLSGLAPYTYFAGDGIILDPNPTDAYEGDSVTVGDGLIIAGAVPFIPLDDSINIL